MLILHEMPSLSAGTLDLAERVAATGYDVYVPLLWGRPDDDPGSLGVTFAAFGHAALHPEFQPEHDGVLPRRPIVRWLAALCRQRIQSDHPRQRIGVIGMCISGSFPLMLAAAVPELPIVPVLSQPALPFFTLTTGQRRSFGLDATEINAIRGRTDYGLGGFHILAFRFEGDRVSPPVRLQSVKDTFTSQVTIVTLPACCYQKRDGLPLHAHSVLTGCYVPPSAVHPQPVTHEAFLKMLGFLDKYLKRC